MKRIYFIFLATCFLLLCACEKTPSTLSDEPTAETTVPTGDGQEQNRRPPAILLNGTQKVEAGSCRWSHITDGEKAQLFVGAPHPHKHYNENHPVLYTETGKKNTVSLSCELPPKEVTVSAFKMSEKETKSIPVAVTEVKDAKGVPTYVVELLTDDFYAYDIQMKWERLEATDSANYSFYSKVQ